VRKVVEIQILKMRKRELDKELKAMREYIELPSEPLWRESKHKPRSIKTLRKRYGL
jgi:hypothetical protein